MNDQLTIFKKPSQKKEKERERERERTKRGQGEKEGKREKEIEGQKKTLRRHINTQKKNNTIH